MHVAKRAMLCALIGASGLGMNYAEAGLAVIPDGVHLLANHPDGEQSQPHYGLILQDLYTNIEGSRTFAFDFEHEDSAMWIDVDSQSGSIRVFGSVFGGRDIGGQFADDAHRGVYQVDFEYNLGVGLAPGDDDYVVMAPATNSGRMITPLGDTFQLFDFEGAGGPGENFRLGDGDLDLGHRGYEGVSGWGRLRGNQIFERTELVTGNWVFTIVPAPGSTALGALGLACLGGRRRRSGN